MFTDLGFHLIVAAFVSLSVLQKIRILKVIFLTHNFLVRQKAWLRLEPKLRDKARRRVLIRVLTVHKIIIEMHVTSF